MGTTESQRGWNQTAIKLQSSWNTVEKRQSESIGGHTTRPDHNVNRRRDGDPFLLSLGLCHSSFLSRFILKKGTSAAN
jgi:hypothetical protein